MEGGRILGQGSYGCVFTPPLLCKSKKSGKAGIVGKLTESEEAQHEIQIANRLQKVPLVEKYVLLPQPESCELAPQQQQKDKDVSQCEAITRNDNYKLAWKDTRQMFLPFGGRDAIGNMILGGNIHPKYFSFFPIMKHILEAGSLLLVSGVCHYDLHPNNFLQDSHGVVRILDLGQAFDVRNITEETVAKRWKMLVFGQEKEAPNPMVTNAEPCEITVINAMRNGYSLDAAIRQVLAGKEIFRQMEKLLGMSSDRNASELKQFFETSNSVKEQNWVDFFKLYWTGFDAWSIGALLLHILSYQISWVEFVAGEWKEKEAMTKLTLKGLLHPNPRKRLDCVEALFLFDPTNSWIQKFGKSWLERRHAQRESQKN